MIVIVGGGVTGLVLAHELRRRGAPFVVFEAGTEPGGVIRSVEVEGRLLELGPQRTRLTPPLRALVAELGLEDDVVTAPADLPLLVHRGGKLRRVPFSLSDALRTDLISWPGKARILLEPLTRGEKEGESVADFLSRKFGHEAYRNMLGPLYGGLYASDPRDMPMRHSLSRALKHFGVEGSVLLALLRRRGNDRAPALSFRRGLRALPDALCAAHEQHVRLGEGVERVRRGEDGWIVETAGGETHAEHVVFTTPADVTARLLGPIATEAADRLSRLTYNPLAVVHLLADGVPVQAMGYQVAFGERLETRGVTFNHCLFGRDGVYTVFLGGAKNPDLVALPDEHIAAVAAGEFRIVTGRAARVLHVSRVRIPAWDRSWDSLDGLTLPPGIHLAANFESRAGIPGRLARARQLAEQLAGYGTRVPA